MSLFEAVFLGFVQGLTEFLPVSSSAHLVIVQKLMGIEMTGLAFEVFLHFASLLAVIIFFRKEIIDITVSFIRYCFKRSPADQVHFRFGMLIILATLITGVLGIGVEKVMGDSLKSSSVVATSLFVTGFFLIAVERINLINTRREKDMTYKDAIIVGLAQTLAVIPGISRSGSTLVAALWSGLTRETAVRYSFLLSIPVILGSSLLMIPDLGRDFFINQPLQLLLSFFASFVSAIFGIKWLIYLVNKSKLDIFAYYVFLLGILTFIFV